MLLPESIEELLLFLSLVSQIGFGGTLAWRGKKGPVRNAFMALVGFLSVWTFCLLLWVLSPSREYALWSLRLSFLTPPLALASFVWLSKQLGEPNRSISRAEFLILFIPAGLLGIFSVTPWIVQNVPFPRGLYTQYGFLHPFYAFMITTYLGYGCVQLFRSFLRSKARSRLQIWYVFAGAFFSGTLVVTVNLLLPLVIQASALVSIGPVSTLFFLGFASYAIIRFRLMAIHDFLRRAWVAFFLVALLVGTLTIFWVGNVGFYPFFIIALANAALGTLLLIHNWKSQLHQSFAVIPLAAAVWTLCVYFVRASPNLSEVQFYSKLSFAATTFIPLAFLYFAWIFPDLSRRLRPGQWLVLGVPAMVFIPAIMGGWVVEDVVSGPQGYLSHYGPFYPLFSAYMLGYTAWFIGVLFQKYRKLQGISHLQMKYIFLGVFGMAIIALTTNLLLPMMGIFGFTAFGPFSSLLLAGSVTYAILRFRLMSVEFVVQRGALYGLVMLAMLGIYSVSFLTFERVFSKTTIHTFLPTAVFTAVAVTLSFQPLLNALQRLFERWFFPSRYDYQITLRDVSREIASVIRLADLVNLVVRIFGRTIGVSETSLLLLQRDGSRFRSIGTELVKDLELYRMIELPSGSAIVHWLQDKREPLFRDEIGAKLERAELEGNRKLLWDLSQVRNELERIGSDNWVPIFSKDELRGMLVVGHKLSGDIYTAEDIALIITLANQIAVALENTILYQEIVSLKDYNENIFHSLGNGVLTTDSSGKIVTLNRAAENLLGVTAHDALGKNAEEVLGSRHPVAQRIQSALRGRETAGTEAEWKHPNNTVVPALVFSRPLTSSQRAIGALVILQDRFEVRDLEDRIRRADKLAAIGTMAAGMAHEIKNPLASMKVLIQLLPKKIMDAGFQGKLHQILPKEIERIDRIVEGLLSFARTTVSRKVPVDINHVIQDCVAEYADQAENAQVTISQQLGEIPPLPGDTIQLQQVFANLIRNGIEAMPQGGVMKVQTSLKPGENGTSPLISISITDTGLGIPAGNLTKLFDPFFTTKHGGTGLGLAITHSIIQSHGGSIDVRSQPGEGTQFVIRLPLEREEKVA